MVSSQEGSNFLLLAQLAAVENFQKDTITAQVLYDGAIYLAAKQLSPREVDHLIFCQLIRTSGNPMKTQQWTGT